MSLETLRELVSPEFGHDEAVDWQRVESLWGVRFPSDYKEFMALYGEGSFNNSLHVHEPPTDDPDVLTAYCARLANMLAWLGERGEPALCPAYPSVPGLILWGGDWEATDIFWRVDGDDPDMWPIVLWSRGRAEWRIREPGMVRLPARFVSDNIDRVIGDPWPDLLR